MCPMQWVRLEAQVFILTNLAVCIIVIIMMYDVTRVFESLIRCQQCFAYANNSLQIFVMLVTSEKRQNYN